MNALLYECIRGNEILARPDAIILRDLLSRELCSHDRLFDQCWGHDPDGGPDDGVKRVDVYIYRLRKKIVPTLRIVTDFGHGYRLNGFITCDKLQRAAVGAALKRLEDIEFL